MAGIACALGEREDLCVHMIRRIEDLHADNSPEKHEILILDIAAVPADKMLAIAHHHPNISTLAIDIHGGHAYAFTGRSHPLHTTLDLTELIQQTDDFVCSRPNMQNHSWHCSKDTSIGGIDEYATDRSV